MIYHDMDSPNMMGLDIRRARHAGVEPVVVSPGIVAEDDEYWSGFVRFLNDSLVVSRTADLMDIGVSAMVTPGWSVTNAKPDSWWGSLPRWDRRMLAALFWPGDPAPTIWYSVLLGRTFEDPPTPEAFRLRAEILRHRVKQNLYLLGDKYRIWTGKHAFEVIKDDRAALWPQATRYLDKRRDAFPDLIVAEELLLLMGLLGLQYNDAHPLQTPLADASKETLKAWKGGWAINESRSRVLGELTELEIDSDPVRGSVASELAAEIAALPDHDPAKSGLTKYLDHLARHRVVVRMDPKWIFDNHIDCQPPRKHSKYQRLFELLDGVAEAKEVTLTLVERIGKTDSPNVLAIVGHDGNTTTIDANTVVKELPKSRENRAFWANPGDFDREARTKALVGGRSHTRAWLAAGFTAHPKFHAGTKRVKSVTFLPVHGRSHWYPHRQAFRPSTEGSRSAPYWAG